MCSIKSRSAPGGTRVRPSLPAAGSMSWTRRTVPAAPTIFGVLGEVSMRTALVCGAGGFIGGHLVKRLKSEGFWVRGVDLKFHEYSETEADDFVVGDLRDQYFCRQVIDRRFDEIYQLAATWAAPG